MRSMPANQLYKCSACGHIVASNASVCAGCGTPGPIARHPNSWRTAEPPSIVAEMLAQEASAGRSSDAENSASRDWIKANAAFLASLGRRYHGRWLRLNRRRRLREITAWAVGLTLVFVFPAAINFGHETTAPAKDSALPTAVSPPPAEPENPAVSTGQTTARPATAHDGAPEKPNGSDAGLGSDQPAPADIVAEVAYRAQLMRYMNDLAQSLTEWTALTNNPHILDEQWRTKVVDQLTTWKTVYSEITLLSPPKRWAAVHSGLVGALANLDSAADDYQRGLNEADAAEIDEAGVEVREMGAGVKALIPQVDSLAGN
jgi:hypothetical protein